MPRARGKFSTKERMRGPMLSWDRKTCFRCPGPESQKTVFQKTVPRRFRHPNNMLDLSRAFDVWEIIHAIRTNTVNLLIAATIYFGPASPELIPHAKFRIWHFYIWHRCGFGLPLQYANLWHFYISHRLCHISPARKIINLA